MPFRVMRIDHVEVFVTDIARSADWYRRALGLWEVYRWNPEPVMIGAGDTKLALFRSKHPTSHAPNKDDAPGIRWRRVAWLTDGNGFAAAQTHLKSLAIRIDGPYDHGRTRSIYFHDLDGNPLEITAPT